MRSSVVALLASLVAFIACGDSSSDTPADGTSSGGSSGDGSSSSSSSSGGTSTSSSGGAIDAGPACTTDDQCEGHCVAGVCSSPTTMDGKLSPSLGETDVDCGGAMAPKCVLGKTCAKDGDCAAAACSVATKKCVEALSCKGANGTVGIDTCGPSAKQESCCKSLPLPTTKTRTLDRYEITAGRLRAFITAAGPDLRKWAKDYAAAHPNTQLASIAADYAGLLDILPNSADPTAPVPLPVHLGAFVMDPLNKLDGCYVNTGSYGHATYWQDQATLASYAIPKRLYERDKEPAATPTADTALDKKSVNCVMPLVLATFCAWDGGELARTSDYYEVWDRTPYTVGTATVYIPWSSLLSVGSFNWRNGHGDACPIPWPGCVNPQPYFYRSGLADHDPANDDSPAIAPPGRFDKDVTKAVSASGEGWYDVAANMMEAAWPNGTLNAGPNPTKDFCDTTATAGMGETPCTRNSTQGVKRYSGALPVIALVGYSFEGHMRRSEAYLGSNDVSDESTIIPADVREVTLQYGKITGRCARKAP